MRYSRARFAFFNALVVSSVTVSASTNQQPIDDGLGLRVSVAFADARVPPAGHEPKGVCAAYKSIGLSVRYFPEQGSDRAAGPLKCIIRETLSGRELIVTP